MSPANNGPGLHSQFQSAGFGSRMAVRGAHVLAVVAADVRQIRPFLAPLRDAVYHSAR